MYGESGSPWIRIDGLVGDFLDTRAVLLGVVVTEALTKKYIFFDDHILQRMIDYGSHHHGIQPLLVICLGGVMAAAVK